MRNSLVLCLFFTVSCLSGEVSGPTNSNDRGEDSDPNGDGGDPNGDGGDPGGNNGGDPGGNSGGDPGGNNGGDNGPPIDFDPPTCSVMPGLPEGAPDFQPGVWTNISPAGVRFNPAGHSFTQGMTIDPCNPATLYACIVSFDQADMPNNGLYRSLDAGATWLRLGSFMYPLRVRVDPEDPLHIYVVDGVAGSTNGFYRTTDGGETWAIPQGFRDLTQSGVIYDTYHVEPDPNDFDHVLVTFHNPWAGQQHDGNSGIIESFDGGDTWTIHPPVNDHWAGGYNVFFLRADNEAAIGKTWLFGTQGDGYYRTANAGESWQKVSSNNMDHGGGRIYYAADGTLYASGEPNVLRSTDNGVTWTSLVPQQFSYFLTVVGDGNRLYTANHHGGRIRVALESDDTEWANLGDDPEEFLESGPFEMRFDEVNRILYSAHTGAGVWAYKVP